MRLTTTAIVVYALALGGGIVPALRAQGERTVWDGVYTTTQATRGAAAFDRECASCHGSGGAGGGMAPALAGTAFSSSYDSLTLDELFNRNWKSMPVGREGQLPPQDIADITAFMLQANGFPAGKTELPTQTSALKTIRYLAIKP